MGGVGLLVFEFHDRLHGAVVVEDGHGSNHLGAFEVGDAESDATDGVTRRQLHDL